MLETWREAVEDLKGGEVFRVSAVWRWNADVDFGGWVDGVELYLLDAALIFGEFSGAYFDFVVCVVDVVAEEDTCTVVFGGDAAKMISSYHLEKIEK